jgi:hypothetical protein
MPMKCKIEINLGRKECTYILYEIGKKEKIDVIDCRADCHKENI